MAIPPPPPKRRGRVDRYMTRPEMDAILATPRTDRRGSGKRRLCLC